MYEKPELELRLPQVLNVILEYLQVIFSQIFCMFLYEKIFKESIRNQIEIISNMNKTRINLSRNVEHLY